MKLPLSWMKDFAPVNTTPAEFADKMTMTGSKVEHHENEGTAIQNVVIGRIDAIERHADSDHLWVCKVNVGTETVQIVTGAQNLSGGELCPVALHGAKLPGGIEIKRGKLRGVESQGMLCSISELNLTINDYPSAIEDGIMVLSEDHPLGANAAEVLGLCEDVFTFEITPNRPDCLSIRGLAREAAVTFGVPFSDNTPQMPSGTGNISDLLSAVIESTDTCLRYTAAMIDNVRIKESPEWMRRRLRHAGVRPINNIVDITNYVMLEYGQPMHAFDYAYVNGGIITTRFANAGESIVTLDGVTRDLDENMMIIADEKGPIAVAGVMGGEYSGVYETTKKVVFESASFHGPSVRATSRKLGLRTEASSRFEKSLDPNIIDLALARTLQLVKELDAGDIINGTVDIYPNPKKEYTIPLSVSGVNNLLGITVTREEIVDILAPLGFTVNGDTVTVPTTRTDVKLDCDIAEEVVRFIGYNKVAATVLQGTAQAMPTERQCFDKKMVDVLVGCGLWQCETFSFYGPKSLDAICLAENDVLRNTIKILHPLGEDTSLMRTTALPSILEVTARNWAARTEECAVFEMATEYRAAEKEGDLPTELKKAILAAYGKEWDYFTLKGVVESVLSSVQVPLWKIQRNTETTSYHPGRCADIYVRSTEKDEWQKLGIIGEVHPSVLENYDIKPRVTAADLDMDVLFSVRGDTPQSQPLPRFPALTRDLALVANSDVPAADIAAAIRAGGGKRLQDLMLFDIYTGDNIGEGKKSLAYSLVLRDTQATLTDEQADSTIKKILQKLSEMQVVLRS